jgi:hypothetical protein
MYEGGAMLDVSYMLLCALDVQEPRGQSRENALRGLVVDELVTEQPSQSYTMRCQNKQTTLG